MFDSWVITLTVFGSFWPIFTKFCHFLTNYRICWGCLWSYNISSIYNSLFLSDSTHSMSFYMTECWFFSDFHCFRLLLAHFYPFSPSFWLIIGSVEVVFSLTTFLLLSPTISEWYHSFNFVLCEFIDIFWYFGIFLGCFPTFLFLDNHKYLLNGQKFYELIISYHIAETKTIEGI